MMTKMVNSSKKTGRRSGIGIAGTLLLLGFWLVSPLVLAASNNASASRAGSGAGASTWYEPEMVYIRGGSYKMGCASGRGCEDDEKPVHRVSVGSFLIGKFELTFDQWDACYDDGGCDHRANDHGWGRGSMPVVDVSWKDAKQYVRWLARKTGKPYRLPTEAEWEYAARAGTKGPFSFSGKISTDKANYDGSRSFEGSRKTSKRGRTVRTGYYPANPWGLHEVHANAWEWTEDCWHDRYSGAPRDGSAWLSGSCDKRSVRSGSWNDSPTKARSANRYGEKPGVRDSLTGFRVAMDVRGKRRAKAPSADLIKKVQTELHRIGYYDVGRPDGVSGPKTRQAVRAFRSSEGLGSSSAINRDLLNELVRFRKTGNEFYVQSECSSPIEVIAHYKDLQDTWQTRAWWKFEPNEKAYLAHHNIRLSARKGVWYFYARATDDSGYYWDDNNGDGKRVRHGGKTYKMRRMSSTGDRAELTLTCN